MRFGFVGPSYQALSPLASAESLINFYVEKNESPMARSPYTLYGTPGLSFFCTLKAGLPSTRGSYVINGRIFFVAGTHLFEVLASGTVNDYGDNTTAHNQMLDDGLPVTMVAGGTQNGQYPAQLLIASGGTLTAFSLVSNSYEAIAGAPADVVMIDYLDGFFIALQSTNDFSVSNPEDCTTWPGLSVSQVSVYSDALLSMIASNRLLWVFGAKRGVAYYNSGAPLFPFDVANGGFLEVGILAQFSLARIATATGTTIGWLAGDERGAPTAYIANGFTPQRISDHAIEWWMSQQKTVEDAIGWAESYLGHNFYVLTFPTANATWVYDIDLGFWHRRASLINGKQAAHRARCHSYNFGMHLVGDYASGTVYQMSQTAYQETLANGAANPIVRQRIGPTLSQESQWMFVDEFQVDVETGLGPMPPLVDGFGNPRGPQMMMQFSKDFGKSWGSEFMVDCGQAGDSTHRAVLRRLGKYRQFTAKVHVSDPIQWSITDAYINPTEDSTPTLKRQLARMGV